MCSKDHKWKRKIMKKIKMRIEIVSSSVNELSSMSLKSRNSLLELLSKYFTSVKITTVNNVNELERLVIRRPDLVFLGMKFLPASPNLNRQNENRIWISEFLDQNNINFTGSSRYAHNKEFSKQLAKQSVLNEGLNTAAFRVIKNGQHNDDNPKLKFPLFVKPTDQGGGTGIDSESLVSNNFELNSKVKSIFRTLGSDSLVEEYLPGREFSVAILKNIDSTYDVMPIELIAGKKVNGIQILSASLKSTNTTTVHEIKDETLKSKISALGLGSFHAIGARDYGRIDIRLDADGVPNFLEANLIPSIIENSGNFPKACKLNINLGQDEMILRIVNLAINRRPQLSDDDYEPNIKRRPITLAV